MAESPRGEPEGSRHLPQEDEVFPVGTHVQPVGDVTGMRPGWPSGTGSWHEGDLAGRSPR